MVTVITYESLGHTNFGWLDARYHFSFANYYNPERAGFGVLRVINDDTIQPGKGFDTHPHRDMEIITYVREGAITHRDSNGNEGRTAAGEVQVMTAGSGIHHSEYNLETSETRLYQIWIEPNQKRLPPQWAHHPFPRQSVTDKLPLLVSGDGTAPLTIHQDAKIFGGQLDSGNQLRHPITHQAYVLVSKGQIKVDGVPMQAGDGAEIVQQTEIMIEAATASEVLVIDVPNA